MRLFLQYLFLLYFYTFLFYLLIVLPICLFYFMYIYFYFIYYSFIYLFIVHYITFSFYLIFDFDYCNKIIFSRIISLVGTSFLFWNSSSVLWFQEGRARLLSSVCLLNNNYDSPARASSSSPSPGSVSPKSRRSSLPAGPTSSNYGAGGPQAANPLRAHSSIHETIETKKERRER